MTDVIERYLHAVASHDWGVVNKCIADGIVRVGAYGDRYSGRDDYMAYLTDLMPKLNGYSMAIDRVTYASETLGFAELSEMVSFDGTPHRTAEVLVFALDGGGRIARVDIFIQSPSPVSPTSVSAKARR
jgi:SnoaL-like domain